MDKKSVQGKIKKYLKSLPAIGIHPYFAVLFGSFAEGRANKWSDIDIIVIAPEFDQKYDFSLVETMWEIRSDTDSRLEPIPCGMKEWESGDGRPIIEVARKEGIVIKA